MQADRAAEAAGNGMPYSMAAMRPNYGQTAVNRRKPPANAYSYNSQAGPAVSITSGMIIRAS